MKRAKLLRLRAERRRRGGPRETGRGKGGKSKEREERRGRKRGKGVRGRRKGGMEEKTGPVTVSDTLCPAVHILGTRNVYSRAKGTADNYWPQVIFFSYLN